MPLIPVTGKWNALLRSDFVNLVVTFFDEINVVRRVTWSRTILLKFYFFVLEDHIVSMFQSHAFYYRIMHVEVPRFKVTDFFLQLSHALLLELSVSFVRFIVHAAPQKVDIFLVRNDLF